MADFTSHNEQNDVTPRVPLYAGTNVIGEAADIVIERRHNALRWHEFSRTTAPVELGAHDYSGDEEDDDELASRAQEDTWAQLTQGASAGA